MQEHSTRVRTRVDLAYALHTPTHIAQNPPGAAPWTQQCEALSFPFLIKKQRAGKFTAGLTLKSQIKDIGNGVGVTARERWGALPPRGPKGRDHAVVRGGWQCRVRARGVGLRSPLSTAFPMLRFLWNLGFFLG